MIKLIVIFVMLNGYANNYKYSYSPKTSVVSSKSVSIKPLVVGDIYFMKKIFTSKKLVALVDDEDYDYLNQFEWNGVFDGNNYYATRTLKLENGKTCVVKMHREIMKLTDSKLVVDHINSIGLDNRKENLRICTAGQNSRNRRPKKDGKSKYLGVIWLKYKWAAIIRVNNKNKYLGVFSSEKEAALAYNNAIETYSIPFARPNNLEDPLRNILPEIFINNRTELDFSEEGEIWKNAFEYENSYKVSSLGKVFNVSKRKLCSFYFDKDNYHIVHVRDGNKHKEYRLHRLLADSFLPNPENKKEVNHINSISGRIS